ncbi:DUF2330 domain-containing protein [Pseudenhygromyxa sp. WMMC2535]|uniref:DUF2330 domain-containing protein n=1 Tax=Pseudenhygromyxa sp. WMMC2535 TaxID=2712867 RepID=UPI0015522E30|nr:DUF2330 domain-containing protein [Pseudenhygromyxa sp. WMMC2535]NVB40565.1 DUF2330 domain-containing protein [Pseudenhygromyxa sp. WMMC2535]
MQRHHSPFLLPAIATTALGLGLGLAPSKAAACGGTFCDNTPEPMPVDQRGEDILFVQDGTSVEAHVRVQYTGEAERFAWLVPLQAIPEISVGSDLLFTNLSLASAASWTSARTYECPEDEPGWDSDDGGDFVVNLDVASEPEVVFEDVVGAFEVVVLQGGTAAEVIEFLDANDYAQDADAEPILQTYLDEGFLFAAVKLAAGAEVEEIHPLTFRFLGDEPCVPIRLTRIAAEEDMGIRAYFLSTARWAPSNYEHVVLNPLRYDWSTNSGYVELLSLAVDEAGGQAFVTDYAGSSDSVSIFGLFSASWNEQAFVDVDPITAIDLIAGQGLNTHPMIQALLMQYIPPPDGVSATVFWNEIEAYADQIDLEAWDGAAFASDLSERIIEPGMHALDLLETWPYLTRLHTTMSPAEMTVDPMFHQNPDLPTVDNLRSTPALEHCGGDSVYDVDLEGTSVQVCQEAGTSYPDFSAMPAALRIEQVPAMGAPQVVTDNSEAILAAHALAQADSECASAAEEETGDSGESTSDDGGDDVGDDESGSEPYDLPYDISCGCSSSEGGRNHAPLGVALGLLVLACVRPRRRRG